MKITIQALNPPEWRIQDAASEDIQRLVKFADLWSGVKIEQHEVGHLVIRAGSNEAAEAFDSRFQDCIDRAP